MTVQQCTMFYLSDNVNLINIGCSQAVNQEYGVMLL